MAMSIEKWNENFRRIHNFSEDNKTWIAVGDTYAIKDELKKAGAKFSRELGWHFNFCTTEFTVVELSVENLVKDPHGKYHLKENVQEIVKSINDKYIVPTNSNWVGEIGKRETFYVMLSDCRRYASVFGDSTILTFKDENENSIVWFCSAGWKPEIGAEYRLRGTVKAHNEFRGDKQTIVNRCELTKLSGEM